jgi:hypothetical protein
MVLALPVAARAQTSSPATAPAQPRRAAASPWTGTITFAANFFPDDHDLLQPTVYVDRGALHLEARYNYEDTDSTSVFAGWNLEFGSSLKFAIVPIAGFVAGQTDGGIVGAKVDLTWRFFEAYSEAEWVLPTDGQNRFLYSWSEFSVWATDWLRVGVATQRTRTFRRFRSTRDIEPGVLVGLSGSVLEGSFYVFNPGSGDRYFVVAFGVNY